MCNRRKTADSCDRVIGPEVVLGLLCCQCTFNLEFVLVGFLVAIRTIQEMGYGKMGG